MEAHEQKAQAEGQREDRAHGRGLPAVPRVHVAAERADRQRAGAAEGEKSEHRGDVEQHARRGAGKADLGQHVRDEALAAKDDEVARGARQDRHQRPGQIGVLHEVEIEEAAHLAVVGVVAHGLVLADDHEAAVARMQHLDGRAVQARQGVGADDVMRRA